MTNGRVEASFVGDYVAVPFREALASNTANRLYKSYNAEDHYVLQLYNTISLDQRWSCVVYLKLCRVLEPGQIFYFK